MNVSQLNRKLLVVAYISIIVAFLPKGSRCWVPQVRARPLRANLGAPGGAIAGEGGRLTQQQMNMLRHDNVPINADIETEAHILQASNEQIEHLDGCEIGTTAVTTKSYKMALPGFVKAPETAGHEPNLRCAVTLGKYTIVGMTEPAGGHDARCPRFAPVLWALTWALSGTLPACEQDIDYYPYGGVEEDYCPVVSQNYRFTGKEHDAESGLENFEARYDASSIGRFMTPDDGSDQTVDDPQSWNLYAYVRNQPLRYVDPTGHGDQGATAAASSCAQDQGGGGHTTCNVDTSGTTTAQNTFPFHVPYGQQGWYGAGGNQPPPTNPDGSPKAPPSDVPKPPPGKPPGWKPGDPLAPNDWARGKGTGDRPTRWDPKYPVPGQSQPNVSWGPEGHWDYNDGFGNRTRYGPDGGQVDHDNNPTMMDRMRSITPGPILKWGTVGVVGFIIIDEGSRFVFPLRNLVPVP